MSNQTAAQRAAAELSTENLQKALSYPQTDENEQALKAELDSRK